MLVFCAAQGIETRSAIDAKRRGPKGESPVRDSECAHAIAMETQRAETENTGSVAKP
jgi:hypothetical protein